MKGIVLIISLIAGIFSSIAQDNIDAKRIFENSIQKLSVNNVRLEMDIESFDRNKNKKTKSLNILFAELDQEKKALIEITAPENIRGTKILTTNNPENKDILFIYMPSTGKTQKIRTSDQNLTIAGNEIPIQQFNHSFYNNYTFTTIDPDTLNGVFCSRIKLQQPEKKDYEIAFVSKDNEQLLRLEKYNSSQQLTAITEMWDYIEVNNDHHKVYPGKISIKNLKTREGSDITLKNIEYIKQVTPEDFRLTSSDS